MTNLKKTRFNPNFAIDARTETKKAEAVSTKKVQVLLVAWKIV